MSKGTREKIFAAAGTVLFMALVRTNADWKLWQAVMIGIALYESLILLIKTARYAGHEHRRKRYFRIQQQDARRWAEEWFNPMKEVSR